MLLGTEDIAALVEKDPTLRRGCIVDTNVLFAASFPLDTHNDWAEKLFDTLHKLDIPIFTNVNVRSEFIQLNRRVMIPEGLSDLYDDLANDLDTAIEQKLKSLKTRKAKAAKEEKTFKLSDIEIKEFRDLLGTFRHSSGLNGWDLFCRDYFAPFIIDVWKDAVSELKIQFLGTREIESKTHFKNHPNWEDMVDIVGRTGIGTSDAMIINLFLNSTLPLLATVDRDVPVALTTLNAFSTDRIVISKQKYSPPLIP